MKTMPANEDSECGGGLAKSLLEAYRKAEIDIEITQEGLSRMHDEALPDWYARSGMVLEAVCLLTSIGLIVRQAIQGASWMTLMSIAGLAIVYILNYWLPMNLFLAVGCLVALAPSIKYLQWPLIVLCFYACISVVKRLSLWLAVDRLKRLTFGCDENAMFMVYSGFAIISPTRTASPETRLLLDSLHEVT